MGAKKGECCKGTMGQICSVSEINSGSSNSGKEKCTINTNNGFTKNMTIKENWEVKNTTTDGLYVYQFQQAFQALINFANHKKKENKINGAGRRRLNRTERVLRFAPRQ